jgi:hypothetical protein
MIQLRLEGEVMDNLIPGKVRIEYRNGDNTVQLYNSFDACSLVINGVIVDQYLGAVATRFNLKGTIIEEDKTIQVEARMGLLFMCIYYDNVRVARKFMGLG